MNLFQILVVAGLALAILFLLAGFLLIVFGTRKTPEGSTASRIEFSVAGQSLSIPYSINITLCVLGVLLLFLTFDFYKNSGSPNTIGEVFIATEAYAKSVLAQSVHSGWVYFGYGKDPKSWNFQFLNGNYDELVAGKKGIKVKNTTELNIRNNYFGNLTGTVLSFISPAPKIVGKLPKGTCVLVSSVKSVGFDKIWLNVSPCQP